MVRKKTLVNDQQLIYKVLGTILWNLLRWLLGSPKHQPPLAKGLW